MAEMHSIEELKRRAEDKFFEEEEFTPAGLYALVENFADIVRVRKGSGEVRVEAVGLTAADRVAAVLCARYLAWKLRPEISPVVTVDEVAEWAKVDRATAMARLSDLVRRGLVARVARGQYSILSYPVAERLARSLLTKLGHKAEVESW